jgi:hypothetical protein
MTTLALAHPFLVTGEDDGCFERAMEAMDTADLSQGLSAEPMSVSCGWQDLSPEP